MLRSVLKTFWVSHALGLRLQFFGGRLLGRCLSSMAPRVPGPVPGKRAWRACPSAERGSHGSSWFYFR